MEELREVLPYLPISVENAVRALPKQVGENIQEIRMKAQCPLIILSQGKRHICDGVLTALPEIQQTFRKICASSAYTHRNEICSGFVTLPGGHRVGIMGTAVMGENGNVEGMRDIYGLSFRIARDFTLPLSKLTDRICSGTRVKNLLLIGPPCSGKTTVLRSLARNLSQMFQVCIVDEREELFPGARPVPVGCDVLRGYPKAVGIQQGLRTLSPGVIVCDEIGTGAEVSAMLEGLRSGVSIIVSAHAFSVEEVFQRPPVRDLFLSGGIDLVAILSSQQLGEVCEIKEREDLCVEMCHVDAGIPSVRRMRGDVPT